MSASDDEKPPIKDPFVGLRGIMAGVLILEVIVVVLALPVMIQFSDVNVWSVLYIAMLLVLLIAGAGLQRRSWAIPYNLGVQFVLIAGFFIHPAIGSMGAIFLLVWLYILYVRREVKRRWDRGELPAQRMR